MSDALLEDPIPPSVGEIVTVFKNDLSSVNFPDVSLETLETLTQKVRTAAEELSNALQRAEAAREALEAGQAELHAKAARGLAYAKVFAEGNDALLEKLSSITVGKAGRSPKKAVSEKPKAEQSVAADAQSPKTEEKKAQKSSKKNSPLTSEEV